jgi:hypothetical protein
MANKKDKKLIRYTDRDFNSIKQGLVDHAKRYYPNIFQDFSEASFGSLMLDTVSYVGDVLSFYLDYQTNESFLDTAVEYDNILRLAEHVGYKEPLKSNSFGVVSLYALVPTDSHGVAPDEDYLPTLLRGTTFSSEGGQLFTLVDDVDFSHDSNEIVVATSDTTDGSPSSFAIKAYGRVVSGETKETNVSVGEFKRFLTVPVSDTNISEIVSVVDTEGHEYFEVDYLSQDTIFRSVVNQNTSTRGQAPSIIVATSVPRRFVTFNRNGQVFIKFGYGSESSVKIDNISHPSNVVLKMNGKNYEKDTTFDPSKLLETNKFGVAPANTTLTVVYRTAESDNSNVSSGGLKNVSDPLLVFGESATSQSKIDFVTTSIEVTNEKPITGDVSPPTVQELKQRINDTFSTQNRAVTASDYEALIYRMPSKFGKIKRARLMRDHDSFKRNLNLYLVSEDFDGNLLESNAVLKNNVKVWLNNYKMINDTIDILDPKIVNIGIKFVAVVDPDQDKFEALNVAITEIQDMFAQKLDIGQPVYITKIYDILNNLDEVVDVTDVQFTLKNGGRYSDTSHSIENHMSADGRILYCPDDMIYELKYPNLDIEGTIR